MSKKWYVVHTQTGCEEKVKANIESWSKNNPSSELVSQVLVPTEKVSEVKDGKKRITNRKFFPGYVLVEMDLTDEAWYLIKNTPGVSGFIGAGRRPVPLMESEIETILKQAEMAKEKPTPKVKFSKGENVRILEGPFINFNGIIEEINPTKGKLKVTISIFGRSTPVELEYWQVEKV